MLCNTDMCVSMLSLMYAYRIFVCFFFQAEDGIRDLVRSRGLGDVYKRQIPHPDRRPSGVHFHDALDRVPEPDGRASLSSASPFPFFINSVDGDTPVSYTHLRAHETVLDLVCRLLLEKKTTHYYQLETIFTEHYTCTVIFNHIPHKHDCYRYIV